MESWDELRVFLAVAECGSITAGAHRLGVDQSTVSRRIHSYEERLGRRLFLETKKRNQLTPFGEACLRSAQRVAAEMESLRQELRIGDDGFKGTIRIQTGDILSNRLLLSVVSDFLEAYPQINIRITDGLQGDDKMQADVAIFATNTPNPDSFGRKLASATFASYASAQYVAEYRQKPEQMAWLNWDDGSPTPTWPKLSPPIADERCRLRCTSVASLVEAAKMGLGATVLPCFIGEIDRDLCRLNPKEVVSSRDVWIFVQPDIRQVPKIRTFLDHLYTNIEKARPLIEAP